MHDANNWGGHVPGSGRLSKSPTAEQACNWAIDQRSYTHNAWKFKRCIGGEVGPLLINPRGLHLVSRIKRRSFTEGSMM